ncbi:major capsid protein [Paenibacillus sp. FSL E2-0190]|uniref:major capsid protein n=1 Tax=Paenibacillus sp. FSL E2-0190 TaxID=2954504 RepID=UPI0030ED5611
MGILSLDQFKQPTFLGYVENRVLPKQYLLKAISEFDVTFDLTFDYDVFTQTYTPGAAITGWNSGAPLRDKQGLKTLTQEIAKLQHGVRIDEREQLKFKNPRVQAEREKAIQKIYDQTDKLIEGVNDTEEWLRGQAVYLGVIVYQSDDAKINVNFNLPAMVTVATPWTNRTTSTPIDDIRTAFTAYKKANGGAMPVYMDISGDALLDLMLNQQVRGGLYGVNNAMVPNQGEIEALIRKTVNSPQLQIRVNDDEVSVIAGGPTRLLPLRTVAFLGDEPIITVHGPTVEKDFNPGIYVVPKSDMGPPPQDEIYVGESAFVGVKKPSQIYRLSV